MPVLIDTAEGRVAATIGDLVMQNASLQQQVDDLKRENSDLKQQVAKKTEQG